MGGGGGFKHLFQNIGTNSEGVSSPIETGPEYTGLVRFTMCLKIV